MAYSQPNACENNCSHDELTSYGYEAKIFIEPNKTIDFLCVICQQVAKKPRTHYCLENRAPCKVIFCSDCLKNYVRHHRNSLTSQRTQQMDVFCPFRCGANLIMTGPNRNIGTIPRRFYTRLANLKMLCPFGKGSVRYIDFEDHNESKSCYCKGFNGYERRILEKRIDSILNQICAERHRNSEIRLLYKFALILLNALNPE